MICPYCHYKPKDIGAGVSYCQHCKPQPYFLLSSDQELIAICFNQTIGSVMISLTKIVLIVNKQVVAERPLTWVFLDNFEEIYQELAGRILKLKSFL